MILKTFIRLEFRFLYHFHFTYVYKIIRWNMKENSTIKAQLVIMYDREMCWQSQHSEQLFPVHTTTASHHSAIVPKLYSNFALIYSKLLCILLNIVLYFINFYSTLDFYSYNFSLSLRILVTFLNNWRSDKLQHSIYQTIHRKLFHASVAGCLMAGAYYSGSTSNQRFFFFICTMLKIVIFYKWVKFRLGYIKV